MINPSKLAILERFAAAGSPDDCGHNPAGRSRAGKFSTGNTCASGGSSRNTPQTARVAKKSPDNGSYKTYTLYDQYYTPKQVKARLVKIPLFNEQFYVSELGRQFEAYYGPGSGDEGAQIDDRQMLNDIKSEFQKIKRYEESKSKEISKGSDSKEWFKGKKAEVANGKSFDQFLDQADYDQQCIGVFGKPMEPDKIAAMCGIDIKEAPDPKDDIVIKRGDRGAIQVIASTDKIHTMMRTFKPGKEIFNDEIGLKEKGSGEGLKIFANQVQAAIKAKMKYIECQAAGHYGHKKYNGYYTWPRLGYDSALYTDFMKKHADAIGRITGKDVRQFLSHGDPIYLSDLMKTKEGRDWWKENGIEMYLKFDLTPGSRSRKILSAYLKERGIDSPEDKDRFLKRTIIERFALEDEQHVSKYAKAGSAEDCGHEESGRANAGKFASGNTCASGGSRGNADNGGSRGRVASKEDNPFTKPREQREAKLPEMPAEEELKLKYPEKVGRKFVVTNKNLPQRMRGLLSDEDLSEINSPKAYRDMIALYDMAVKEARGGVLPTLKEIMELAKAGESTKGQYEWTGNMLKEALGEADARTWAGLNSVLSAQSEYRAHTIGAMRMLRYWIEAGRPTDDEGIDKVIKQFDDTTYENEAGERVKSYPLFYEEKAKKIKEILKHNGEVTHERISKTRSKTAEFYDSWFKPGSFAYDKWMSKITKPGVIGKEAQKTLVDLISKQSSPKRLAPEDKEKLDWVVDTQVNLISNQSVYNAYKALAARAGEKLGGWEPREIQETVWSAAIAIGTLKAAGMNSKEAVNNLMHEMVHQSWDIQELLKDEELRGELVALGIPKGTLETISSWEKFSDKPQPPQQGRIEPGDRSALERVAERIAKPGNRTVAGKKAIVPDKETGKPFVLKKWGEGRRSLKQDKDEFMSKREIIERFAAGDADDCGHERQGGQFTQGNTCAEGGGSGSASATAERPAAARQDERQRKAYRHQSKASVPDVKFNNVDAKAFIAARDSSERPAFLSSHSEEELNEDMSKGGRCFVSEDGRAGYYLSSNNDLQNVFNNGGVKGAGIAALVDAIANGAETLDCYEGYLPNLYNDMGFTAHEALEWDDQYAASDWDYEAYGRPDVVFMRYDQDARDPETIKSRIGTYGSFVNPRRHPEYGGRHIPERGRPAPMGEKLDQYKRSRMGGSESGDARRSMEVHPEPLISRYANAVSGSDCGHEPRGTPKAGKFARGNTCASKHRHKRSIKEFTKSDMKELKSEIGGYLGKQQKKAATLNEIKNDLGFSPAKEGDPVNYAIRSMRDSGEVEIVSNRPGDPIIKYKIIAAPGEAKNYAQQILGNLNGKPRPSRLDPGIRGTPEESRPSPFRQGPRLTQEQIDSAQRLPMKMRDARSQKISRPALYNMERFAMAAGESSPKKSWSDPKAKLKIQKLKAFFDANGHKIVKEAMKKFDEQLKRGTNSDEIPDRTEKVDSIVDLFT